ncbi:MAG TPA: LysR family transcriptional regulator [Bradyrhizobium sp.]|jgi:DNA-binding transcriptional LysR family regulator|uniref:LysR family transcriptional regulator n=1 Tax=Bradyrhizobium sp. TaxID=376 RepID=UPI002C3BBCDD|nr:LysR family transcriptional regulator [Bradyrhizobium sp.]HTB03595.1 LysR family transcriptional regulator [Bradyrhizobium sp.]
MDLLGSLGVLVRVVETGSFSAVARERELSQAAVARQISQLEEHFGVRLFHRTTRKLSLTDDGQMLLGLARPVLDGVDGIEAALGGQRASPVGLVRVGVTVTGSRFLAQRLPTLLADHPGLKVELVVSDAFGDMIEDRLDLAMRMGEVTDASLVVRRSGTARFVVVAAPDYIERKGRPSTPADLAGHICIVHDVGPGSNVWTFVMPEGSEQFHVSGGFLANDVSAVRLAARSGYGVALLPLFEVLDDLRSGMLVCVLSEFPAPSIPLSLVYSSRRHLAPRTRVVFEFLVEQVREVQAMLATVTDKAATA